jgi:hypothetical protein
MSLEAFGDDGLMPSDVTAEDLERAGWGSNADATVWWKIEGEEMTFEEACEVFDSHRTEDLEDYARE